MKKLLIGLLVILCVTACGKREKVFPRATAYPRVEIYDSVYRQLNGFPLEFYINAKAKEEIVKDADSTWWNVRYPDYKATLHLSSVPVKHGDENEQMQARIERMVMNVGGAAVTEEEFCSPDSSLSVLLFYEPGYTPTPVQFVALGKGRITSGVFGFDTQVAHPDSVAPQVMSVVRDVRCMFSGK